MTRPGDRITVGTFAGQPVEEVVIGREGMARAHVMTWGAVVRDLEVPAPEGMRRVVLGFPGFEPYPDHSPHFGAIAGRFANRIGGGRCTVDGEAVALALNQRVPPGTGEPLHHLHGGPRGFGKINWTILRHDPTAVTLALVSPDGDQGYPGTLTAVVTYAIVAGTEADAHGAWLVVTMQATTDRPTIVNLVHHSYFNLDGSADIGEHRLQLDGPFRTAVDEALIPTGEILATAGTAYDFRAPAPMARERDGVRLRFDDNFIRAGLGFGRVATVAAGGLAMEVWSDQPAIQFYDGAKLGPPVPGHGGVTYGPHAGFCLEPQRFPDSPNRPHFSDCVLRPGEVYRQRTEYRFRPA